MSHLEFKMLGPHKRDMMVCSSAGVSLAICSISTQRKNTGETPPLPKDARNPKSQGYEHVELEEIQLVRQFSKSLND
jgi:hypothetical protein